MINRTLICDNTAWIGGKRAHPWSSRLSSLAVAFGDGGAESLKQAVYKVVNIRPIQMFVRGTARRRLNDLLWRSSCCIRIKNKVTK